MAPKGFFLSMTLSRSNIVRNAKRPRGTPSSSSETGSISVTSIPCGMCTTGIDTFRLTAL